MENKQMKCVKRESCLHCGSNYCRFVDELEQLKAENEELRQFLSKEPLALQALQSAYASYKKSSEVWADIATDYKQTLTEIKEICKSVENIENINSLYDAKLSGMFLQANKILQKISECEVENDNK